MKAKFTYEVKFKNIKTKKRGMGVTLADAEKKMNHTEYLQFLKEVRKDKKSMARMLKKDNSVLEVKITRTETLYKTITL